MMTLSEIAKGYGQQELFAGVNLTLGLGERVGLVGPNGTGKTTLLRVMSGELEPDRGNRSLQKWASVGYLEQEVPKFTGKSVLEEMLAGHRVHAELESELRHVEEQLRSTQDRAVLETLSHTHGDLLHRFEHLGGYDLPARAKRILAGLGFKTRDLDRGTEEFSGGWLMRLALARLLLTQPDLLLLDEPTNYLDLESVIWLEEYLREHRGTLVVSSHDRVLLNNLSTRIVEIEHGDVTVYTGTYDEYRKAKAVRLEGLIASKKAQDRERAKTQLFIDRFRSKNTKASQVQSRIKRLEKMEVIELPSEARRVPITLPTPPPIRANPHRSERRCQILRFESRL